MIDWLKQKLLTTSVVVAKNEVEKMPSFIIDEFKRSSKTLEVRLQREAVQQTEVVKPTVVSSSK
jgi:hypothetical protein